MNRISVLILGGGPAGLTLSLYLQDLGIDSRVLEKSSIAGGLARSFRIGPYTFDHSGHLLHTNNKEVLDLVERRLKVNLNRIERRSVCLVDQKFIPYPYQQNIYHLNAEKTKEAVAGFFRRKITKPRNFREWLEACYGSGIGRQFLFPYNQKLWNVDLRRMSVDWVPRFLPSSDAKDILKSAFYREKAPWGYNAIFYYPKFGGIGTIGKRLSEKVSRQTSLNAHLRRIDLRKKTVDLEDGETWNYVHLVSTIPLPEFLRLSGVNPSPLLRSTGVTVFNVGLRRRFPHDFHWCYVPESDIPFYRFGVYSNISPRAAPRGHSALYIECADRAERLKRFRFSDVRAALTRLGFIRNSHDIDCVQRLDLRTAYPIPLVGLAAHRDRLQKRLRGRNVELMGRFGAWKYVAISDVMVEAKGLAAHLAARIKGKSWTS